jgi:hypothetical protein
MRPHAARRFLQGPISIGGLAALLSFLLGVALAQKGLISIHRFDTPYSIGIYEGTSPLDLKPSATAANPVLTSSDVTDLKAGFVADPFILREDGTWHMFFEVMDAGSGKCKIGHAASPDGRVWSYDRIVLDEPFHLSFPFVFKEGKDFYMIPESSQAYAIKLYRATHFPDRWECVGDLLRGNFVDSCLLPHAGRFWLFTSDRDDVLRLYSSPTLDGPWKEHPKSPLIVGDGHHARLGGRMIVWEGKILRFAQDDVPDYGQRVFAFEVTTLTETDYAEREIGPSPALAPTGTGWNGERMHHLSAAEMSFGRWIAAVDGVGRQPVFPVRIGSRTPER